MPTGRLRVSDFRTVCSILGVALALAAVIAATSQAPRVTDPRGPAVRLAPSADAGRGRQRCRELSERGPRADAIAACDEVVKLGGSAEDMWAASAVRVTGAEAPTMDDLIRADVLATAAIRLAPGEPWGYLAELALARRWGDPRLVERRLHELERAAPGAPETAQAQALARPSIGWGRIATACVLALLCAATAAHALRRLLRHRVAAGARALSVLAVALWIAQPRLAAAEQFAIDPADPERGVPTQAQANAKPLEFAYYLQDLTERADDAVRRGDHDAASRYFRAMARAVPDSSVPFERLCRLGVRLASVPLLEECTAGLAALAPTEASTRVYQWSLALHKGQSDEARQRIAEARAAGLGEDALARMVAATPARGHVPWLLVGGLALAAAAALVLVRRRLRPAQWTTTISGSS